MNITSSSKLRLTLGGVILLVALSGCGGGEDFLESGKRYLATRDYVAATIQFKNAVGKRPDDPEIRYLLANTLSRTVDLGGAEIEYRKALSLGYDKNRILPELIQTMIQAGKAKEAIEEAKGAVSVDRATSATITALKGDALLVIGDPAAAQAAYEESLKLAPKDPVARLGQARLAVLKKDWVGAERIVEEVIRDAPDAHDAWFIKANLLVDRNDLKGAISSFDESIARFPADLRSYTAVVPALLKIGDVEGAAKRAASLARVAPGTPTASYVNALVAYAQGNKSAARDTIKGLLKAIPDEPRILMLAGILEYELGNNVTAEQYLAKIVTAQPSDTQARYLLASTQMRLGKAQSARKTLAPLMEGTTVDSLDANALAIAGEVYIVSGATKEGSALLNKALARDPRNASVLTILGRSKLISGDAEGGVQDLEAAIALQPNKSDADEALIGHYLRIGGVDQAAEYSARLAKRSPTSPVGPNALGLVALARRDLTAARSAFSKSLELAPTYMPAVKNLAAMDLADKNIDGAIAILKAVLAKEPRHIEATMMLVTVLRSKAAPTKEVVALLDDAIAGHATSPELRLSKVDYLFSVGDKKAAREAAQEAQAVIPDDPNIQYALARVLQSEGDYVRASASYGHLTGLAPTSIGPLLGQVELLVAEHNLAAAKATASQAISRFPDSVEARLVLADIEVRAGQIAQARNTARAIQTKWPRASAGYAAEMQVLMASKDTAGAERVLREGLKNTDDAGLATRLIGLLVSQNRVPAAESEVESWIAKHPSDFRVLAFAGGIRMSRGEYAPAAQWLRRADRLRPDTPEILNNLAWTLGKLNDKSALEVANRALQKAPKDAAILDTVGTLEVQFGAPERGVELMQRAVSLMPEAPTLRLNLARGLLRVQKGGEAKAQLEKAAQLNPNPAARKEIDELLKSL
ncbi:MAG: XrtA/PEP-CTERM system TPR-repeat protein PrsT [Burkholderiales bacterium]